MTRYILNRSASESRPWSVHPIWRGIGCLWLIILPAMSYAGAWVLVRKVIFAAGFQAMMKQLYASYGINLIPGNLYQRIDLPYLRVSSFQFNMNSLISWLPGQPLYNLDLLVWFLLVMVGFGVATVLYAFMYRSFGPPKSPYDSVESKRYRRPY